MTLEVGTNSYVTIDEANTHIEQRYGYGLWDPIGNDNKENALISSFYHLEAMCDWYGYKTDSNQTTEFPRDGDTETPTKIKHAQIEMAYQMVAEETANIESEDVLTKLKAGSVELNFKGVGAKTNKLVNDYTRLILRSYGQCHYSSETKVFDYSR